MAACSILASVLGSLSSSISTTPSAVFADEGEIDGY